MKFTVTAQSFDRQTGRPTSDERDETIDTATNELFEGRTTILDVRARYEEFWNGLNPESADIVLVSRVSPRMSEQRCPTCGNVGTKDCSEEAVAARIAAEDNACPEDPDGVHFVGCGCENKTDDYSDPEIKE